MSGKVRVQFMPGLYSAEVEVGSTLLSAARQANAPLEAPCDGAGVCGKCTVRVERRGLGALERGADIRADYSESAKVLACHAKVRDSLTVTLPESADRHLAIVDHGLAAARPLKPHIRVDRTYSASMIWGDEDLLAIASEEVANLGVAIDIGTTTVVVAMVDLDSGVELAVDSTTNPQVAYGHDVLSRIRFASEPGGLATLQRTLVQTLNDLIRRVCGRSNAKHDHIHEAVLSGNTCMIHLVAGVDPSPLGRAPYLPAMRGSVHIGAASIGLGIAKRG